MPWWRSFEPASAGGCPPDCFISPVHAGFYYAVRVRLPMFRCWLKTSLDPTRNAGILLNIILTYATISRKFSQFPLFAFSYIDMKFLQLAPCNMGRRFRHHVHSTLGLGERNNIPDGVFPCH